MSSFGEELRRERELRQITLREIAEATKINLRYLEALEHNRFEQLPGGVFNKGFIRAYAQFIGVDPESTVDAYLLEERARTCPEVDPNGGLLRGARSREAAAAEPEGVAEPAPSRSRRGWLLGLAAIGALALGALGLYLFGVFETREAPPPPTVRPQLTVPAAAAAAEPRDEPAPPPVESAEPETPERPPATAVPPGPETAARIEAVVQIERTTAGRLNCDNRQIEILDGLVSGTTLRLACERFLLVDAADGGALRIGLAGQTPQPVGKDGLPLSGHRIEPRRQP